MGSEMPPPPPSFFLLEVRTVRSEKVGVLHIPTDRFTILELQNQLYDVPEPT